MLGVFAKTFPGTDPDTVLASVSEAGYSAAHYNMSCSGLPSMPDAVAPDIAVAVSSAARKHGVTICGVSGTFNMIHPDPAERRRGLTRLEVIARSADLIGTDLITLCTGTRDAQDQWRSHPDNATPAAWRDLCSVMAEAVAIAETHGLWLGIEPELANVVSSATLAQRLIDELQSDRIRIVFDPANLFDTRAPDSQRPLVSEAIDRLADLIVVAHAKDRTADGTAVAPGTGVVDFDHYLTELDRIGFRGPLVSHGFPARQATSVALFLDRQLAAHRTEN